VVPVDLGQQRPFGRGEAGTDGDLVRDDGAHITGEALHDRAQCPVAGDPRDREQRVRLTHGVLLQPEPDQGAGRFGHVGQRPRAALQRA
jgi:hypothetical protein